MKREKKRLITNSISDSVYEKFNVLRNQTLLRKSIIVELLIKDTDKNKIKRLVNKYTKVKKVK